MDIVMDPGGVSATGDDVHQIAAGANDRTKSLFTSSDTAAQDNPGWASGAALTACKDSWQGQLASLIQKTVDAADNLKDSAAQVASADREAEDRLARVMHDLADK
jgi:hypothetical protein